MGWADHPPPIVYDDPTEDQLTFLVEKVEMPGKLGHRVILSMMAESASRTISGRSSPAAASSAGSAVTSGRRKTARLARTSLE